MVTHTHTHAHAHAHTHTHTHPPQILGAIGHPQYNDFSVLTNLVVTGFHCTI